MNGEDHDPDPSPKHGFSTERVHGNQPTIRPPLAAVAGAIAHSNLHIYLGSSDQGKRENRIRTARENTTLQPEVLAAFTGDPPPTRAHVLNDTIAYIGDFDHVPIRGTTVANIVDTAGGIPYADHDHCSTMPPVASA
jgi:hypothetical protein